MSAIENMIRVVLTALDIDVDTIKGEVTSRVVAFETNINTLNATLISLHEKTERNAAMLESICDHLHIEAPPQINNVAKITGPVQ